MNETVVTALISALVSLVVSFVTAWLERRKLNSEESRHAQDLKRRLTEKMLDLRLQAYPLAFKITDQLRGEILFNTKQPISAASVEVVLQDLQAWHREKAGFLLTAKPSRSIAAYRALRNALAAPLANSNCSQEQLQAIWQAKNELRGALKSDLRLLYQED